MYNSSELILRRGQSCRLTLEFNKPLQDWQSIVFVARTGPQDSGYPNTNVEFSLSSSWTSGMWSAVLESSPGNSLRIIMSSPANAVIGRYDLSVRISVMGQTVTYSLGKFILLFNPWCLDDDVYMANEEERQEYVLNDHGVIFMGNEKHVTGMGWNLGQFENNILNICLDILDRSLNCQKDPALDCSQRFSPIYVGRVISAMINSNDDFGVLEGKWEKDFSDGVDPNSWNGSVEILWKWKNDNYQPVKYGQCWVFAAVMCTGKPLNFHVWNESWFLRRDLGDFYGGWQVLDSTPQETSQGIYRCGPTSVTAVKEGDLHLGFDAPFVFAEVNADRVTWIVQKDGTREKAHSDTKYIGQSISTKAVGSDARVDVTNNYKHPEGSPQERQVFEKASRTMPNYVPPKENVSPDYSRPSPAQPSGNEFRSGSPSPFAPIGRPSSPALFSGRPSSAPLSGNGYRPSSPSLNSTAAPTGRPSSPASFSGRASPVPSSGTGYRPASPSPAIPSGRSSSPARFSGYPSPNTPGPSHSASTGTDVTGKFKLLSPLVVGDDINLLLILKNLTPYHRPVKVNLSASTILYTGRRLSDIFTDQKSLIISPSQDAHISLQIPYSHYSRSLNEGNMIQVVALCELPFGEKMVVTKNLVLENPPIVIKPLSNALLHKTMSLEIRFTNPLQIAITDCTLVVEGSGLIDRQLIAVVPFLKPREKIKFKVELTPYRPGIRQLIANFKCRYFSIKGYKLLNVESW
uniref:Transglutaminase-like domain-containing protein n=1 Tax=Pyxicephalus adspersus TaxID=30357 RepID=A0AAV3ATI3_PYXAD|nr:TPA: hypothetical protein GDO54_008245 [Pyxicephalus adspersus]